MTPLIAILSLLIPLDASLGKQIPSKIDKLAEPLIKNGAVVGMAIGIIDGTKTRVYGYGKTEKSSGTVPAGDTVFEIGSITKVFTTLTLAKMVVDGDAALNDTAKSLMPKGAGFPRAPNRPITLGDLAAHVSGLPRLPDNIKPKDPLNPYADYTEANLLAYLAGFTPTRDTGKTSAYSNTGMGLLGYLLARKESVGYESLIKKKITTALGMTDTSITLSASQKKRFVQGYFSNGDAVPPWDMPTLAGAGALRSTVDDMLKFLAANVNTKTGPLGKAAALSHRERHSMGAGKGGIGLGWQISPNGWHWHNGATYGSHSILVFDPKTGKGVVILSNTFSDAIDQLGFQILKAL